MKFVLTILFIFSTYAFSSEGITKFKNKTIYGCFNEIKNDSYASSTLILRRDKSLLSKDFIVNDEDNANSVLIINRYKSKYKESFEVAPLKHEGKINFADSNDGWEPKTYDQTFFTAKGNLKAFSIQDSGEQFLYAKYAIFAGEEINLICTSNKKLIQSLFLKLIDN